MLLRFCHLSLQEECQLYLSDVPEGLCLLVGFAQELESMTVAVEKVSVAGDLQECCFGFA